MSYESFTLEKDGHVSFDKMVAVKKYDETGS